MTAQEMIRTAATVRDEAKAEYALMNPAPAAPEPPVVGRPGLVHVGDHAHLWVDVVQGESYGRNASAGAKIYVVARDRNNSERDQRIEGSLTVAEIDGLIAELQRAKVDLVAQQAYLKADAEHNKANRAWEEQSDEFARRKVAEFEREQKAKGK